MRVKTLRPLGPRLRSGVAMTLIELIGVLAVLAILASILLPALIKQTDKLVADQEASSLQSYGDALQRYIIRNRRIPGAAGLDWATNIANELGVNLASVTNTVRRVPRVFLVDTTGFAMSLPYLQNNAGVNLPPNPRIMIASSLGRALPTNLVSGGLSSAEFTNLWNWAPGTALPNTGIWADWKGDPNDLMVQRIHLSPLFMRLLLTTNFSDWGCGYRVDTNPVTAITSTMGVSNYFIQGTILDLYYSNPQLAPTNTLDSSQILIQDSSFVFYGNEWRRSLGTNNPALLPTGSGGSGTNLVGSYDFASLINGFLSANPTSLTRSQQTNVVQSFIDYMNAYNAWANSGFQNSGFYTAAVQKQSIFQAQLDALVNAINVNYVIR